MPQIEQLATTYSSQIFWLLLIFGLVFVVIGRGMVPRIMNTVSQRDQQIADDLASAEGAHGQANAEEDAWRKRESEIRAQAQAVISGAKTAAAAASEKKLSAAQKRIDAKLAEAEAAIDEARTSALAELAGVASDLAQDLVAKLTGAKVTKSSAAAAVKKALAHG